MREAFTGSVRRWAFGSAAVVALYLLASALQIGGARFTGGFTGLLQTGGATAVTVACWIAARRSHGRARRGWVLLSLVSAFGILGEGYLAVYGALGKPVPVSATDDLLGLVYVPVILWALLSLPGVRFRRLSPLKSILDGLIIAVSLLFLSWAFVLGAVYRSATTGAIWTIAYPVADVAITSMALFLALRATGSARVQLRLVGLGLAIASMGDLLYAYRSPAGGYNPLGLMGALYLSGFLLIGAAARVPWREPDADDEEERPSYVRAVVPYSLVAAGLIVAGAEEIGKGTLEPVLFWSALAVVGLVVGRHLVSLHDNVRFTRTLEERVAARTVEAREHRRRAERNAAELGAFQSIVLSGVEGTNFEETVDRIVETMAGALDYESFAISLMEGGADAAEDGTLHCVGAHGFPADVVGWTLRPGEGVNGRAVAMRSTQVVRDTRLDPDYLSFRTGSRSEVCVPIVVRGQIVGTIDVESNLVDAFDEEDVRRLERLAPKVGLILVSARLLATERASVERLRELDGMKSEFIAITSHELRTPLTSISGFVKVLRRPDFDPSPEDAARYLEIIDTQADRLIGLVEQLRIVSNLAARELEVTHEPVPLRRVVDDVLESLGGEAARVRTDPDPADVTAITDRRHLTAAIQHLLQNALRFSPPASPVELSVQADADGVAISVTDRGPGIPEKEQGRIFDLFYQVEESARRTTGGFGLGLSIVKMLVDALGGSIEMSSVIGEGTTFRVLLPSNVSPGPTALTLELEALRP